MSLSDLAALGSFVSGLAVVVTLILLLLQMQQTNRNQRSLMQQGRSARMMQALALNAEPHVGALFARVEAFDTELSTADVNAYIRVLASWYWTYEDSFLLYRAGTLDAESWNSDLASLKSIVSDVGGRVAWRLLRRYSGGPYREFVDALLREVEPQPTHLAETWHALMKEEAAVVKKATLGIARTS